MPKLRVTLAGARYELPLRKLGSKPPELVHVDEDDGAPLERGWQVGRVVVRASQVAQELRCAVGLPRRRGDLVRVYTATGRPVEQHASTLKDYQPLEPRTPESVLDHVVSAAYALGEDPPAALRGGVHACPFVYRAGPIRRTAHVLEVRDGLVALVGVPHRLPFVGPSDLQAGRAPAVHLEGAPRLVMVDAPEDPTELRTPDGDTVSTVRVVRRGAGLGDLEGRELPEEAAPAWLRADGSPAARVGARRAIAGRLDVVPRLPATTGPSAPLRLSGERVDAAALVRGHVVAGARQLRHLDGDGYRWLRALAEQLATEPGILRAVGSGPDGGGPIVWQAGGRAWRGWLRGEVEGERFRVVLHLAEMRAGAASNERGPRRA